MRKPVRGIRLAISCLLVVGATSCVGARIVDDAVTLRHPVTRMGTAPIGGEVADLVVSELRALGTEALTTGESAELLKRLEVPSTRVELPENRERLRNEGIDGWLLIVTKAHAVSSDPAGIEVRLLSTHAADQAIQFTWKNGRGGMPGSIADATMRKSEDSAAKAVAAELVARLKTVGSSSIPNRGQP